MTDRPLEIADLIPGGILPTDHVHHVSNDRTCSRCRKSPDEDSVPLMLWFGEDGDDLLIYCDACRGEELSQ